jgi:site-specific recombinase XerD
VCIRRGPEQAPKKIEVFEEEKAMSEVEKRGQWKKDKAERGVFKRGKIYYIRFADQNGKVRAEAVGPSKALALKVYAKRKTQVAERRYFPDTSICFDELIKDVIAEARRNHAMKRRKTQLCTYRYRILGTWFAGRRGSSIRPEELDKKLSEHCRTPANFNRYRNSLSHAYRLAIQNGKARENPARLLKLKQENNTRVRFLEPEEETALREAIQRLHPAREAEFDLALFTGMRWAEQYGLTWPQVNWKLNEITLLHTKSGKKQHVRVNKTARTALERLRAITSGSEFVCPNQDHRTFRLWWEDVMKAAKVENFHWHDLRHTFASRLVMAGTDIYVVSKLLRHGNVATSQRYAHLAEAHLQQAVERLAGVTPGVTVPQQLAQPVSRTIN